jgi:hypothetical protein
MPTKNVLGLTFNKLNVIEYLGISSRGALWKCKCTCGKEVNCTTSTLTKSRRKSCGHDHPNKKPAGEAAFNDLYRRYKYDAKGKNREFNISIEKFKELVSSPCSYCGCVPSKETTYKEAYNGQFIYNGLDRVNNEGGYTIDNVIPCCEQCNKSKRGMSVQEFITWAARVHNYSGNHVLDNR